jgi:hypothetical protein
MLDEHPLSSPYIEMARHMSVDDVAELLERTTWRLIDTAPRDGSPIIAWDVDPTTNPTGGWVIVRWQALPTRQAAGEEAWVIVDGVYTCAPSHWMPVPPQPPPPED